MDIFKLSHIVNLYYNIIKLSSQQASIDEAKKILNISSEIYSEDELLKKWMEARNLIASAKEIDELTTLIITGNKIKLSSDPKFKELSEKLSIINDAINVLSDHLRSTINYNLNENKIQKLKDEPVTESLDTSDYLYHITFFKNLESIASSGLLPGSGQLLGHGGNVSRSSGNIFFTDHSGISHWYGKIEDMAEYQSDNILEDEVIPVVLRTEKHDIDKPDPTAEQAGLYDEYKRKKKINPEDLEIWNGKNWIPINEYDSIDIEQALIKEAISNEDEDLDEDYFDENEEYVYYFKNMNENSLIPP